MGQPFVGNHHGRMGGDGDGQQEIREELEAAKGANQLTETIFVLMLFFGGFIGGS